MKRLIALFVLLPLVAFGQLMPIQRNFFTTNPNPSVVTAAGSNVTVQATTAFNTRTFTVNGQTDTNVVNAIATNVAQNTTIYGSNVVGAVSQATHATNADNATYVTTATLTNQVYGTNVSGAVAQATHATNADNATYVTTGQLTNQVYASNVVAGGTMPMGTLATNTGWDGSVLTMTNSGTARVWSQSITPTNVVVQNNALGTTITPTVWLTNGTAAAAGAQQVSPALMLGGQGWRSGNSTTMPVQMGWYVLPVQGSSANPYARIKTIYSISNAAPADVPNTFIDTSGDMRANSMYSYTSISGGASDFGSVTINNTANYYQWTTRSRMYSPADGDIQLENQATTAFSRLFLGPLTAAWPALKVESTNYPTLSLRNGADNNYTSLLASNVIASANVIATNAHFSITPTNANASTANFLNPQGLFGGIYMSATNTVTVGSGGTYYNLTNYTTAMTNQFTSISTNGFLTNLVAGYYRVTAFVSCLGGNSDTLEGEVFVNETGQEYMAVFGSYDNPARVRTMSTTGILYLPANSGVSFRLNNRSGANNITVWRAGLTIGTP